MGGHSIWDQLRNDMRASIDTGGHTFHFFAQLLNISKSKVVRYVREGQVPSLDEATEIAHALGKNITLVPHHLTWTEDKKNNCWRSFFGDTEFRIEKEGSVYTWCRLHYTGKMETVTVHYCDTLKDAKGECQQCVTTLNYE